MNQRLVMPFALFALTLMLTAAPAIAQAPSAAPSTNETNKARGRAHFNVIDDSVPGKVEIQFVAPRDFENCFEYRSDGDEREALPDNNGDNINPEITDGLYPHLCLAGGEETRTLEADEYVEIRMVFGGARDERFPWTKVEVKPRAATPVAAVAAPANPETREDCLNGGWEDYGFKNQGQCIRYINTGKDSREP